MKIGDQVKHAEYGFGYVTAIQTSTITVMFNEPYGEKVVDVASLSQLLFS